MKIKFIFFFLIFPSLIFAEIELNGLFRNDALWINRTNNFYFSDIVENRLILSKKTEEWRFYFDARLYLLYGEASKFPVQIKLPQEVVAIGFPPEISTNLTLNYMLDLKRAFVRYDSTIGMWTLGKTYINFGNPGVFNPLEFDKNLSISDLKADKSGIFALEYQSTFWELSGFKSYLSMVGDENIPVYGGSAYGHLGNFTFGVAGQRQAKDTNKAGLYFKGDLEVGIYGGYAYHFDDSFTNNWNEANLGLDYSFLDGKFFTALVFYYAEKGATSTNDYDKNTKLDKFFLARYYIYVNITYTHNEFASVALDGFYNLIDNSLIFIPSIKYSLSDGL
ncbi:MAG: hypothetical protein N2258_00265, partial [Brevinematales bacterium]|nr:hypothetical protein [Brevinematales bacterium]